MRKSNIAPELALFLFVAGCGATTTSMSADTPSDPSPLRVQIAELAPDGSSLDESLWAEEARLMEEGFADRKRNPHGRLPPVRKRDSGDPDAWPMVAVKNNTRHGLVVWFAGPCPRTVALAAKEDHTAELCEGRYDIAAQLSADGYLPFVGDGDDLENGYGYSLSFYIVAEPRVRTRVVRRRVSR